MKEKEMRMFFVSYAILAEGGSGFGNVYYKTESRKLTKQELDRVKSHIASVPENQGLGIVILSFCEVESEN